MAAILTLFSVHFFLRDVFSIAVHLLYLVFDAIYLYNDAIRWGNRLDLMNLLCVRG